MSLLSTDIMISPRVGVSAPPESHIAAHHRPWRRVLMISSAFPPIGGPGVQRSAKFAKYLPRYGWRPFVWCADGDPHLPLDESLLADLPDNLDIHRIPRRSGCLLWPGASSEADEPPSGWQGGLGWRMDQLRNGILKRMIPDHMIGWAWRSRLAAYRLIRRENIDALYSTFSPASNHVLAWMLQRSTGLPWVADFRDLWTDDYCYPDHGPLRRRLERRIEQAILERASLVVGVSDAQTAILRRRLPRQPGKFVTITNGVDLEDFEAIDCGEVRARLHGPPERFVLAFTGWFLTDRVSAGLLAGLGRFARCVAARSGELELRIVGAISPRMVQRLQNEAINVTTTGYMPHDQAIRHMIAADGLLLLAPTGRNGASLIPGKAFEYLAAGRPILLVGPGGEAARLVCSCSAGTTVPPDAEAVCSALINWWEQWRVGDPPPGCAPQHLASYSREHLAGRLAELLNHVTDESPAKPRLSP